MASAAVPPQITCDDHGCNVCHRDGCFTTGATDMISCDEHGVCTSVPNEYAPNAIHMHCDDDGCIVGAVGDHPPAHLFDDIAACMGHPAQGLRGYEDLFDLIPGLQPAMTQRLSDAPPESLRRRFRFYQCVMKHNPMRETRENIGDDLVRDIDALAKLVDRKAELESELATARSAANACQTTLASARSTASSCQATLAGTQKEKDSADGLASTRLNIVIILLAAVGFLVFREWQRHQQRGETGA